MLVEVQYYVKYLLEYVSFRRRRKKPNVWRGSKDFSSFRVKRLPAKTRVDDLKRLLGISYIVTLSSETGRTNMAYDVIQCCVVDGRSQKQSSWLSLLVVGRQDDGQRTD